MLPTRKFIIPILASALLLASCTVAANQSANPSPTTEVPPSRSDSTKPAPTEATNQVGLPNPASAFCEQQGGTVEMRTDSEGGQYGVCLFEDGSECDEWAYFRGECAPGQAQNSPSPAPIPSYVNEEYGFSFDPPSPWTIEGFPDYVLFTRPGYKMFIGFQWADDDPKPFRTGMPQGDFVDDGEAYLLGQAVPKQFLVFEGKNKVVAYNGRIKVGDLILVIYLDAMETDSMTYPDLNLPPEIIAEADQVVASFALTSGENPQIDFNP